MALTSTAEMILLASQEFQDLRVDDLSAGNQAIYYASLIQEAEDHVMSRLIARYEATALTNSKLVRRWVTIVALFFLSQRRDNSAQYVSEFERVEDELIKVQENSILIPNVGTRSDMTPSVTNFVIDERYAERKLRVRESMSSGGSHAERNRAESYPSDWY